MLLAQLAFMTIVILLCVFSCQVILFATVSYVGSLGEKYDVNLVGHIRAG